LVDSPTLNGAQEKHIHLTCKLLDQSDQSANNCQVTACSTQGIVSSPEANVESSSNARRTQISVLADVSQHLSNLVPMGQFSGFLQGSSPAKI